MWEKKPVLFLLLATAAILVGTIITMVLPFAWINTEADRIESVTPYSPLELAGRDVYIREGCNNCHTQTVRPLVTEVLRYGEYSKSGEFAYDQPHLWGSRRSGPDLARIGGKYPDEWHYQHMRQPREMIPRSNMPVYAFLDDRQLEPSVVEKKMNALGFPYEADQINRLEGSTEMDAIVAYLQKIGNDIPWRENIQTIMVGDMQNPFLGDPTVIDEGAVLYGQHCSACHGLDLTGAIAADISDLDMPDAELFELVYNGLPDDGMPPFSSLGSTKIWKLVTFIKQQERH